MKELRTRIKNLSDDRFKKNRTIESVCSHFIKMKELTESKCFCEFQVEDCEQPLCKHLTEQAKRKPVQIEFPPQNYAATSSSSSDQETSDPDSSSEEDDVEMEDRQGAGVENERERRDESISENDNIA